MPDECMSNNKLIVFLSKQQIDGQRKIEFPSRLKIAIQLRQSKEMLLYNPDSVILRLIDRIKSEPIKLPLKPLKCHFIHSYLFDN